jgi:3-dehydroquinate dehydratase-2
MARPTIAVLNGPNLNLLGERDPATYGRATLADLEKLCLATAEELGYDLDFRQSNHEGVLVDAIHEVRASAVGLVVNAAAYSHTSIAIRDALVTVTGPVVEVHLTNIHAREPFRHHSYVAEVAAGSVTGCGTHGYALAIRHLDHLAREPGRGAA